MISNNRNDPLHKLRWDRNTSQARSPSKNRNIFSKEHLRHVFEKYSHTSGIGCINNFSLALLR